MGYKVDKPDVDLNLAPMIDVVFLLLIFFIVTSTLNFKEVKQEIKLPEVKEGEQNENTNLQVGITKEKELYVDGEKVTLEELEEKLSKKVDKDNKNTVSIYADKEISFQEVVEILEIIKKLRIEKINFALRKEN